jgi:hypothetical protein
VTGLLPSAFSVRTEVTVSIGKREKARETYHWITRIAALQVLLQAEQRCVKRIGTAPPADKSVAALDVKRVGSAVPVLLRTIPHCYMPNPNPNPNPNLRLPLPLTLPLTLTLTLTEPEP